MEAKRTNRAPISEQTNTRCLGPTKARRRSSNSPLSSTRKKYRQRGNKSFDKMMFHSTLFVVLSLFALGANASLFSFSFASTDTSTKSEPPQSPISTPAAGTNNSHDLSPLQSVGDLVAIGAISLLDSPHQASASSPLARTEPTEANHGKNKLDYIIDFMRANKLTKFCDLITSQETPIRQLNQQLNGLAQFTLFVPTNEALLLMASGQLEQIRRQPELLRQFLAAHTADQLVVPRSASASGQQRPQGLVSLAGGQLRVVTVAQPAAHHPVAANQTTKLELIVNGANVLSGNSYALQEPNNNKVTYAVVHLIDRVLYPMPSSGLVDKVRSLAPRMSRYFELANSDRQLREALAPTNATTTTSTGTASLWTLFLPGDDAFEATPAKLLDQLESNRTFLIEFLRGHLIDGLYFSSQLAWAATSAQHQQAPIKLASLSGRVLEIEAKTVQARTLVLVNSTPLLEPDLMALNGVVHLISRPLLERHLADDCNCPTGAAQPDSAARAASRAWPPETSNRLLLAQPSVVTYEFDNRPSGSSNWARKPAKQTDPSLPESNHLAAELERGESRITPNAGERIRSQRSGSLLVERNNRDFYRPSTAPANLLADERAPELQQQQQSAVVDRYMAVLNATTRQRLRETQPNQTNSSARFTYDRPLVATIGSSTPPSEQGFLLRRPYTPTPQTANIVQNLSSSSLQDQLASSSVSRHQQMIKFQPEDARDPAESSRLSGSFARNSLLQAASDNQPLSQEQLTIKTPTGGGIKSNTNNCAFYDTDCRRILSKLVRLPPLRNRLAHHTDTQHQTIKSSALLQASGSNHTVVRGGSHTRSSAEGLSSQHLDSTFGETESNNNSLANNQQLFSRVRPPIVVEPTRAMPPTQPLPAWTGDEELANFQAAANAQWPRAHSATGKASGDHLAAQDLARLKGPAHGFTGGISRAVPADSSQQTRAEILLLPVKIIQEPPPVASSGPKNATSQLFIERPQQAGSFLANNNRQFHAPTPYSVSIMTTHMPPMFASGNANQHLGRLTNFTAFDYLPDEIPQQPRPASGSQSVHFESPSGVGQSTTTISRPQQAPLKSPTALRKQRIQAAEVSGLESPKQVGRKVVRLQQPFAGQLDEFASGPGADMSITSAKLTSPPGSSLLAAQASNMSANFVRSASLQDSAAGLGGSDFFQDRTIAEIMDDSGLRIDGQQVTFSRLKECLQEAKLLNVVTQTDNALTIFMPTDSAFQRLVQQQALLHQQRQREARSKPSSGDSRQSLLGLSQPPLLPLMARAGRQTLAGVGSSTSEPLPAPADQLEAAAAAGSMASVGDRLTLDCGSQQVRKLLLDHLSARLVQPKQLSADTSISSLNGHQLLLSSVPSKKIVVVDGQPVIAATRAKNGMVYVVNKFLNLTHQMPNVLELMESQPNLTTFLSYLSFSSMSDRLKRETGPLTILAPTNEAFEQLTPAARQLINSDPAALADILRGHIVEGAQFGKLIPMRNQLKTMNSDQSIEAKVIKPNVYLLDNQMTSMRLVGTTGNGVVNAIDRLIVPAWLKVSMGSNNRPVGSSTQSGPTLTAIETMDNLPGTRLRPQQAGLGSSSLNLPTITNQPLRFEQPTNRFSAPSGRDSFLINSSSASPGAVSGNNLVADFEPPSRQFSFGRLPNELEQQTARLNLTTTLTSKNMQLIEKLAQLMQAKKFVKYLLRSGVSEKLKPDMNYVILVPTDQAIEKLPRQIIDLLDRDKERLADLINYHVLDTTFEYINTIPDGQTLSTLNEKDILFNWHRNNTILTASGAVVMGGIQEENIALLIVDRVLYPTPGDILAIISKSPILSNFTSLVRNAGLEKQLSLAGPFTLFAPSDFAFNQLTKSDLELLRRNKEHARRFLLRHLSQPAVFTSSIALSNSTASAATSTPRQQQQQQQQQVPQMTISNSLGEELTLRQRNDYFSVNEVNFSYADVAATNGVVHVIDGLL